MNGSILFSFGIDNVPEDVGAVMEALLDKYADQGIEAVESPDALKIIPFPQFGTPVQWDIDLLSGYDTNFKMNPPLRT